MGNFFPRLNVPRDTQKVKLLSSDCENFKSKIGLTTGDTAQNARSWFFIRLRISAQNAPLRCCPPNVFVGIYRWKIKNLVNQTVKLFDGKI